MNKDNANFNFGIFDKDIPCAFSLAAVDSALAATVAEPTGYEVCRLAGHRGKEEKEVVFLANFQFWYEHLEVKAMKRFEQSLSVVSRMTSRSCIRSWAVGEVCVLAIFRQI